MLTGTISTQQIKTEVEPLVGMPPMFRTRKNVIYGPLNVRGTPSMVLLRRVEGDRWRILVYPVSKLEFAARRQVQIWEELMHSRETPPASRDAKVLSIRPFLERNHAKE